MSGLDFGDRIVAGIELRGRGVRQGGDSGFVVCGSADDRYRWTSNFKGGRMTAKVTPFARFEKRVKGRSRSALKRALATGR